MTALKFCFNEFHSYKIFSLTKYFIFSCGPVLLKKNLYKLLWFFIAGDWMASDVTEIRDVDELEVYYGSEAQTSIQIASYTFEVLLFESIIFVCVYLHCYLFYLLFCFYCW